MRNKREFIKSLRLEDIDGIGLEEFMNDLEEIETLYDFYNEIELVITTDAIELYGVRMESIEEADNRLQNMLDKIND